MGVATTCLTSILIYIIGFLLFDKHYWFLICICLMYIVCRVVCVAAVAVLIAVVAASPTKGWSGRSLSLLDP